MAKILVIDDEALIREMLRQMLSRLGHRVVVASDGEEGLSAFAQSKPDLIITDIIMPNKDGIQLITEIFRQHPNQPVIAISGGRRAVTAEFNLDSAGLLGAKAVLPKPFSLSQLQEALQTAGF
jgi:CheY-like chemotaxis protein